MIEQTKSKPNIKSMTDKHGWTKYKKNTMCTYRNVNDAHIIILNTKIVIQYKDGMTNLSLVVNEVKVLSNIIVSILSLFVNSPAARVSCTSSSTTERPVLAAVHLWL